METRKEAVKRLAKSINWTDLCKKPGDVSIEMLWKIYSGSIFEGIEVSATQYSETKQAFFVGFSECFRFMTDISSGLEESVACDILSKLSREANGFINSVLDRKVYNK